MTWRWGNAREERQNIALGFMEILKKVLNINVRWVMEFLTCGFNISLILSKKMNELGNCCIL